jgi:ribosomal protein S18 acetylase RimI-like enzyme
MGAGRLLTETALKEARRAGYRRIRLDTLPQMGAAIRLYRDLGFQEIGAYTTNPVAGALFLEKNLGAC